MESDIFVNICLGNGLLSVQWQAFTWTNDDFLMGLFKTNFSEIWTLKLFFFKQNEFRNVYNMLFRPLCVL